MRNIIIALLLLLATPINAEDARRIVVNGEGLVDAVPDMATISMGVINEADTGAEAMAMNTKAVSELLKQLKAAGIEPRDVQTNNLSLSPRWDNKSSSPSGQPGISGFVANNIVTVRVRELAILGSVLDAVVRVGANSFHGLSFGLQDMKPALDQARTAAVKEAMHKAELYASAAGLKLGDVISISDGVQPGARPVMMAMEADMMRSGAVPVAQGEVSVKASVTMVIAIE